MNIYAEIMEWRLDRIQQQAAATRDSIMITGGPNSGKSYTVVERTAFLLADTSPSGRVACLAVRKDAASHLRMQLQAHPRARRHLDRVFVGTVDECAESYLRSHGREALGLDPGFSLWSEGDAVQIMTLLLRNLPELQLERGVIRDALRRHWEDRRRSPHAVTATPARERIWLGIAETYGVVQSRHNGMDRHDLPRQAWQALEESGRTSSRVASLDRAKFRHVVVDQGEELTRAQAEFVRRMVAPQGWLSVAGDPTQVINPEADPQILEYLSLARPSAFELPGVTTPPEGWSRWPGPSGGPTTCRRPPMTGIRRPARWNRLPSWSLSTGPSRTWTGTSWTRSSACTRPVFPGRRWRSWTGAVSPLAG